MGPGLRGIWMRTSENCAKAKFREHSADCEVRPKRMNAAPGRSYRASAGQLPHNTPRYYAPLRAGPVGPGQRESRDRTGVG